MVRAADSLLTRFGLGGDDFSVVHVGAGPEDWFTTPAALAAALARHGVLDAPVLPSPATYQSRSCGRREERCVARHVEHQASVRINIVWMCRYFSNLYRPQPTCQH